MSEPEPHASETPQPTARVSVANHPAVAIGVPALLGVGGVLLAVGAMQSYGPSVFLALPFLVSSLAGFLHCYRREAGYGEAYGVATLAIVASGLVLFAVAFEGAICLLMAWPLAQFVALFGVGLGMAMATVLTHDDAKTAAGLVWLAFPLLLGAERAVGPQAPLRRVTTEVVVDAPIETVWETVVAFPKIEQPPSGLLATGIAYPIEATIDGRGVGAVRRCVFSTGAFVEPITTWDEPTHLAFDVTENPPPMREWSVYGTLDPPHLHGFLQSRRGEFRLAERDGKTVLTGTTWYTHGLFPQWYWGPIGDRIIHAVHRRVLDHIGEKAEE